MGKTTVQTRRVDWRMHVFGPLCKNSSPFGFGFTYRNHIGDRAALDTSPFVWRCRYRVLTLNFLFWTVEILRDKWVRTREKLPGFL